MRHIIFSLLFFVVSGHASQPALPVGVAEVDITPDYPVRLSGFGFRRAESEGITQKIWAKALAFADKEKGPAILITAENLCVPDEITAEIVRRLSAKIGLRRERLAITATHTHTAPMLKNVCPTLFGVPIPPEHQKNIDRYTAEFIDALERVALAAHEAIRPAHVSWGLGSVDFAINRRTKGGPVDHDLPVLTIRDPDGKLRAIYISYACHCVTLSHNQISGDWAGFAQDKIEALFPGVVALASVGCGADSNPSSGVTGDKVEICTAQGEQIAREVKRLIELGLKPVEAAPAARYVRVDLALDTPRSRVEWEERAKRQDAIGHHARVNLERLDRGEALPESINYPVQSWVFGNDLAMVFLPGETVVDYSLRLKREFDRTRLWINGYSNEGRCYIPSERILKEGGYEGGGAMIYYDFPQQFAPGLEQKIIDAVTGQIPSSFQAQPGTEGTRPLSPSEGLRSLRIRPGLRVELVAAEPLVQDPVAIDWGADGKLWVCEMHDYPAGLDSNWQPGGRVKFLVDDNGDGTYDRATLFAEGLPFPTGITAWGRGVFICAAPDILYAQDTNGDGKADKIEKLFTGFFTDNFQARVNSLSLGLDNWIYGANGLLGGTIEPVRNSFFPENTKSLNIRNRDFRIHPALGTMELAGGLTQQGRVRDDWGDWFGCDNSRLLLHFPMAEHYARRNPHVPAPAPVRELTARPEGNHLYPASRTLERFNDPWHANRVTSACGLGIYRDTILGEEFYGNAFICEPVHNLVHREVIAPGAPFTSERASDESRIEFLASTDNWFRPAQARPGPDGALYIVDMYRFLIEHPRWIPATRLAQIDIRAGADRGRIYRVVPAQTPLRPIRDLTQLRAADLARALDTPNGVDRDRVHIELLTRREKSAVQELSNLAAARLPQVRIQALSALAALDALDLEQIENALRDPDPLVRVHALRLSEPHLEKGPLLSHVLALTNDSSPLVALQLAFTLGSSSSIEAGQALGALARHWLNNSELRSAVISSATAHSGEILEAIMNVPDSPNRAAWIDPLVGTAAKAADPAIAVKALRSCLPPGHDHSRLNALATVLESLAQRNLQPESLLDAPTLAQVRDAVESAADLAAEANAPEAPRSAAIRLIGSASTNRIHPLAKFATEPSPAPRRAAIAALRQRRDPAVADAILEQWHAASPSARIELISLLLSREPWTLAALRALQKNTVQLHEFSLADRQRLAAHENQEIRALARELLPVETPTGRAEALARYHQLASLTGNPSRGAELFTKNCASCHALNGIGHNVGPDLAPLRSRDADYWVKNIIDPNAVIEPRFVNYNVELGDDRSLSGIIQSESANSITLVSGSGTTENILRSQIREIHPSALSLMPEALEQAFSPGDMADLLAFVKHNPAPTPPADPVLRDAASVARFILDPSQPNAARETAVNANPQFAAALIKEMTRDLQTGTPEEYVRIPWIWRVAIACGKRNDAAQIKAVLDASLPKSGEPLHDWQAVVLGGGIINGLSQRGLWPGERLDEIIADSAELKNRWHRALDLAGEMADQEKVPPGTRYDALRMIALLPWEKCAAQLLRYLAEGTHGELQMGAVSGLVDHPDSLAGTSLRQALAYLKDHNRSLALDGLKRRKE